MHWTSTHFVGVACLTLVTATPTLAWPLLTLQEASSGTVASPTHGDLVEKGISRGPVIRVMAPVAGSHLTTPFALKIAFEAHGGARIKLESFRISYPRNPSIDLAARIQPGLSETGIDLPGVELPPGEHVFKITLADSEGRQNTAVISLTVAR